jgi:hypothetical protein
MFRLSLELHCEILLKCLIFRYIQERNVHERLLKTGLTDKTFLNPVVGGGGGGGGGGGFVGII